MVENSDRKVLLRRIEANARLPALSKNDDPDVDFRSIVIERESLGIRPLTDTMISKIKKIGYDAFFIGSSTTKIGGSSFFNLSELNKIELTVEYVLFHYFRERLDPSVRTRVAKLLLSEAQKKRN